MDTVTNNNQTCSDNEALRSVLLETAEEYVGEDKKKARILADKIQNLLSDLKVKAESMLENTEELESLLERFEKKLTKFPGIGAKLVYVPQLLLMLLSYAKGEYKDISKTELLTAVIVVMYVLLPTDAIPDFIPGAGYLDDAATMIWLFSTVSDDIEAYMKWRENTHD